MALTLRSNRSSNLTATEVDNNFLELSGSIADIVDGTISVASASYAANGGGGGATSLSVRASGQETFTGVDTLQFSSNTSVSVTGSVGYIYTPLTRIGFVGNGNYLGQISTLTVSGVDTAITENVGSIIVGNSDMLPTMDGMFDLGADSRRWFDGYFTNTVWIGDTNITDDAGSAIFDGDIVTSALSADIANIGNINIIENTISVDVDASAEYDGNPTKLTIGTGLEVLGSTYGDKYVIVNGAGTPAENGAELFAAYDHAKAVLAATPSTGADDRFTVVITPGEYFVETPFTIDTNNIDVVSLTGNSDVMITSEDPAVGLMPDGGVKWAPVKVTLVENVTVKGLNVKTKAFVTKIISPTVLIENCTGGDTSFNLAAPGDYGGFAINVYVQSKFKNCVAGINSYMFAAERNAGTFIGCVGGDYSYSAWGNNDEGTYIECTGGDYSFGSKLAQGQQTTAMRGERIRCTGGNYSFGHFAASIYATFTDCTGGVSCFGTDTVLNDGTYLRCTAESLSAHTTSVGTKGYWKDCVATGAGSWVDSTTGSKFIDCVAQNGSAWTGYFAGNATNCSVAAGGGSFGSNSGFTGIAIGCIIRYLPAPQNVGEAFPSPSSGGKQINCIHQNNVLLNAAG